MVDADAKTVGEARPRQPVDAGDLSGTGDHQVRGEFGAVGKRHAAHGVAGQGGEAGGLDEPDAVLRGACGDHGGQVTAEDAFQRLVGVHDGDRDAAGGAGARHLHTEEARAEHDRRAGVRQAGAEQAGVVQCAQDEFAPLPGGGEPTGVRAGGDDQRVVVDLSAVGGGDGTAAGVGGDGGRADDLGVESVQGQPEGVVGGRVFQNGLGQGRAGVGAVFFRADDREGAGVTEGAQVAGGGDAGERLADDEHRAPCGHDRTRRAATGQALTAARAAGRCSSGTSVPSKW